MVRLRFWFDGSDAPSLRILPAKGKKFYNSAPPWQRGQSPARRATHLPRRPAPGATSKEFPMINSQSSVPAPARSAEMHSISISLNHFIPRRFLAGIIASRHLSDFNSHSFVQHSSVLSLVPFHCPSELCQSCLLRFPRSIPMPTISIPVIPVPSQSVFILFHPWSSSLACGLPRCETGVLILRPVPSAQSAPFFPPQTPCSSPSTPAPPDGACIH